MSIENSIVGRPLSRGSRTDSEEPPEITNKQATSTTQKKIRNPYINGGKSPIKTPPKTKRCIQQNIQFKKRPKATNGNGRQWDKSETDISVKQNSFWGNNSSIPHEELFRVYFVNINGLKSRNNFEDTKELFHIAAGSKQQITAFAETNVPWHDKRVTNRIRTQMRQVWHASKMATASAPMTAGEKFYQPGGTAMFINGNWTGRVIDSTEDSTQMGR